MRECVPLTEPVRALRLLSPIEAPVRLCRVPRDARVFMAAPALWPAVVPAAGKHITHNKKHTHRHDNKKHTSDRTEQHTQKEEHRGYY